MIKFITFLFLLIPFNAFAISGDDWYGEYGETTGIATETVFTETTGKDFFLHHIHLKDDGGGTVDVDILDDTTVIFHEDVNGDFFIDPDMVIFGDLKVRVNDNAKGVEWFISGYYFDEGASVDVNGVSSGIYSSTGSVKILGYEEGGIEVYPEFYDMMFNIFMIIFTVFFIGWKVLILVFKKM